MYIEFTMMTTQLTYHCNFGLFKLLGFGVSLLEGVDPNVENMVSAGIVHTRLAQIGVLLRLEPNKQANVSANVSVINSVDTK